MDKSTSMPLALSWLAQDRGISEAELALMAGVSPATVTGFLHRPNAAITTWTTIAAALSCRVMVKTTSISMTIALPRITARDRERERGQWAKRRLSSFRSQILKQSPNMTDREANQTAQRYVETSNSRIPQDLAAAHQRLADTKIHGAVDGLRAAVRFLTDKASINAEDASLMSGMSLGACQNMIDGTDEGRLKPPHQLFSAIAARIVLLPPGGGEILLQMASPGMWRPEPARQGKNDLTIEEIRFRQAANEPIASIARDAGVSRQRIHYLLKNDVTTR